jgi:NAD(P)-dependent dehydrogenase (short-subunit alcohol dehydrogenase family)
VREPRYQLSGRVALITGPARGIGAETARQLAARGMKLGRAGLEAERREALAADLPAETATFECDVTDWDALGAAVDGTVAKLGGIDVVIANAASWTPTWCARTRRTRSSPPSRSPIHACRSADRRR